MINPLPPPMPAVPAQPPTARVQTTAPFEDWLSAPRQAPELGDQHGDRARNPATPVAMVNVTGAAAVGTTILPAPVAIGAAAIGDATRIAGATPAALPQAIDAVFEFHVQREGGSVEVLSVPWRLAGNDMLSRLSPDPDMLTTAQLLQMHRSFDGMVGSTPNTPGAPPFAVARPSPLSLDAGVPTSAALMPGGHTARPSSRAAAELAGPALPASVAEPWLARLLRWFEQQGQDPVVWIRDYSLNDAASQAVADEVRALASQQGWKLQRIVVNAREMWNASSHLYAREKPSCP